MTKVQKRLDLALTRATTEKDHALAEAADKEKQLREAIKQKRVLDMQLHSLGSGKAPSARTDRSDMLCFYCQDVRNSHVEIQFVDFNISWSDFSDILQR